MNVTACEHAETATALYRVDGEWLCPDCVTERYEDLDKRIVHAQVFAENLRVERDHLVALVGYSPAGTSRLLDYMYAAVPETDPMQATPPDDGHLRVYSMTLVDPDGMTRRLRVEAASEEEARANVEIRDYEHVVEISEVSAP